MSSDPTPHERAHLRGKREAIRKRAARLGYTLRLDDADHENYSLVRGGFCTRFVDLDEVADELRAIKNAERRAA